MVLQKVVHQSMNATFCVIIKELIQQSYPSSQYAQSSQFSEPFQSSKLTILS